MATVPASIKVFISYADEDEDQLADLEKHLKVLKERGEIHVWHARLIGAGHDYQAEKALHMAEAQILLLLVTASYMHACWPEMEQAVARHDNGRAIVIPIIVETCDWRDAPLGKLSHLPRGGRPIVSQRGLPQEGWTEVVQGIRDVVHNLKRGAELPSAQSSEGTVSMSVAADDPTAYRPHASPAVAHAPPSPTYTFSNALPVRSLPASYHHASPSHHELTRSVPGRSLKVTAKKYWPLVAASLVAWVGLITIVGSGANDAKTKGANGQESRRQGTSAQTEAERLLEALMQEAKEEQAKHDQPTTAAEEFQAGESDASALFPDDMEDPLVKTNAIAFYDAGRASGRSLGDVFDYPGQRINLQTATDSLANDQARSCVLHNVRPGAVITLFDSPAGDRGEDWIVITVKRSHPRYTVETFERDVNDDYVQIRYMRKRKLDGRVSRVEID
ncbi:toll/interleukin-1 receptor domain-containing protein [Chondromyces apiculatus]|uniref:toll/interleukin-1 receptor domain-containing protein n=1 Tax=Chondromyces apiculatus TaxID=51 RepID=UPI0009E0890F|nr:toll/interleukin-1 receptor domain-containing protein [Chondromyces apiculatus]